MKIWIYPYFFVPLQWENRAKVTFPPTCMHKKKGSRSRPFLIKAILLALCLELLPYQQIGRNTLQPCFLLSFALSPWLLPCYGAKLFLSPFCSCFFYFFNRCAYHANIHKTIGKRKENTIKKSDLLSQASHQTWTKFINMNIKKLKCNRSLIGTW